jgi:hypothetical protein
MPRGVPKSKLVLTNPNKPPRVHQKKLAEHVQVQHLRRKAFELKIKGWSYRAIGKLLGKSGARIHQYVQAETRKIPQDAADEMIRHEIERYDMMLKGVLPAARKGDPKAILAAVRIGERRARLLGLDAPEKQTVDLKVDADARVELLEKLNGIASRLATPSGAQSSD